MTINKPQLPTSFFERLKWHFYVIAAMPGLLSLWISYNVGGGDPLSGLPSFLKLTAVCVLLMALLQQLILPIRVWTGQAGFYVFRKPVGFYMTAYALIHFTAWFLWNANLGFAMAQMQIQHSPALWFGLLSLLLMLFMLFFEQSKIMQTIAYKWLYWQWLWWLAIALWMVYLKRSFDVSMGDISLFTLLSLVFCWHLYEASRKGRRIKASLENIDKNKSNKK